MRLICPNCDAQYEVDAAMIPAAGRDVQCSNCGKTWFQAPEGAVAEPDFAPEPDPAPVSAAATDGRSGDGLTDEARSFFERRSEETVDADPEPEPQPEPEPEPEPEQDPEPRAAAPADDWDDDEEEDDDDDDAGPPPGTPAPPRRELDPAVLGILKAEAERELAARRAEAEAMESQPDLGLSDPEPQAPDPDRSEVEARTARLRGDDDMTAVAPGRRTVLPDIDEINSTLTATSDRKAARPAPEVDMTQVLKRRAGFRYGFSAVMILTAVLILVYLYAPQIAAAVPGAEPALAGYVDWANDMRLSIDGFLERSVDRLTALLIDLSS